MKMTVVITPVHKGSEYYTTEVMFTELDPDKKGRCGIGYKGVHKREEALAYGQQQIELVKKGEWYAKNK